MKQLITKEQWDELENKKKKEWMLLFYRASWGGLSKAELPSIGQMLEFLKDDFKQLIKWDYGWRVELKDNYKVCENPCDALWEAVKYKLCQSTKTN